MQPQGYYDPWSTLQQVQAAPEATFAAPVEVQGFKNVEPRSREEREAGRSKDMLEKQRLRSRYNGAVKYDPPANPLQPLPGSALYQDEYQRFERDAAAAELQARQQRHRNQEEMYARKRVESYQRDKSRWANEEANAARSEQRYEQARATGTGAKSNRSGQDFNIVNLNYAQGQGGQMLKQKDESTQYKAQMRAVTLFGHNHSVPHNIITGAPLRPPPMPLQAAAAHVTAPYQAPQAPWDR